MPINFVTRIILWWIWFGVSLAVGLTIPRTKDYRESSEVATNKNAVSEPTCEELKAMWRFSKRQSRAAEITNEIPMYRDPFHYNVWEPYYATSRSIGGMRLGAFKNRPIYGRLVHKPPIFRIQDVAAKDRAFEEVAKMYGAPPRPSEPRRRLTAFRLGGGGHLPLTVPQSGSFQHLKELIKTERARELQEQRMAEENAARAAVLKELGAAGNHRSQANYRDMSYNNYDIDGREDRRESYIGRVGILPYPNLLAPAAFHQDSDLIQDYGYTNDGSRGPSYFDSSSYVDDFNGGFML